MNGRLNYQQVSHLQLMSLMVSMKFRHEKTKQIPGQPMLCLENSSRQENPKFSAAASCRQMRDIAMLGLLCRSMLMPLLASMPLALERPVRPWTTIGCALPYRVPHDRENQNLVSLRSIQADEEYRDSLSYKFSDFSCPLPPVVFPLIIPTFTHYSQSNIAVVDDSIIFSISPRPHNSFILMFYTTSLYLTKLLGYKVAASLHQGKTSDEEVYTVREKATK
ncbi:hypothetical protein CDAR_21721 [Caerostris darwini]|uniref:Uncharacterized protein n=1 Tax=Caerostris darwini TaxID=1538125 RepID=A0AAV4VEQ8_9ARAC|nr:hypothetical protein CDAR_21721 [Caerostris darwini]